MRNHAPWEAYGFYKDAVKLVHRPPETEEIKRELIEVILLMRASVTLLNFPEDCLSYLQLGERLAKELGDSRELAAVYAWMGSYYSHAGDHRTATRCTEEAFEEACNAQDIELMAPLGCSLGFSYTGIGQFQKVIDKMPEVITLIEKKAREADFFVNLNSHSYLSGLCGIASAHLGRFKEGKAFMEKALCSATRTGDSVTLAFAHLDMGMVFFVEGVFKAAKEHFEKCISYCEVAKYSFLMSLASFMLGSVLSLLGAPGAGRRQMEKGLQIYRESGIEVFLSFCHLLMGDIQTSSNDLEGAEISMEEALRLARKNSEVGWEGMALVGLGWVLGKKKPLQTEKAEECFSNGLAILSDLKAKPMYSQGRMFLGEFYLDTGEKQKAMENLKEAEAMFQEMGMDYWLDRSRTLLERI